jgi:protein phosphatase
MSGKNNEDRYAVSSYQVNTDEGPVSCLLAVVADGIGGHRAGEVAAEIAVKTISQNVRAGDFRQPLPTLSQAVIRASQAIFKQSENESEQKGMGATCACCWLINDRLYTASVGDTRIYLIRNRLIQQISTDHTWIQEAIEHGAISPEEARGHPNAHVIRRYLGSRQQVVPDLRLRLQPGESDAQAQANQGMRLLPGDQIVLCSDGLTDLVEPGEILSSLKSKDKENALEALISLANQRGGHDNITIVALEMPDLQTQPVVAPQPVARKGWRWAACLSAGAVLAFAVVLLGGGLLWVRHRPVSTPSAIATSGSSLISPATQNQAETAQPPSTLPSITPAPGLLPTVRSSPTPLLASLTPWPTNTKLP